MIGGWEIPRRPRRVKRRTSKLKTPVPDSTIGNGSRNGNGFLVGVDCLCNVVATL